MNNAEGVIQQVSSIKRDYRNEILGELYSTTARAFEDYKKEIGFKSLNPIAHVRLREEFYEGIGKAYTLQDFTGLTKAQKEAMQGFRKSFDKIFKDMKESGIEGFENMKGFKHYFPRYHKSGAYDFVETLSQKDREIVADWYGDAIKRGFNKTFGKDIEIDTAKKLAKQLLAYGKSSKLMENLSKDTLFADVVDLDDFNDYFGRAKFRIPIDFNVKSLNIGGKELSMIDFVDTNAYSVMNRYANLSSGHYAFSLHGIKNVDKAIKEVENDFLKHGGDTAIKEAILDYANNIIGRPMYKNVDRSIMDFTQLLKKATSTQMLHASGLSTLSEVVPAVAKSFLRGDFGDGMRAFIKSGKEALDKIEIDSLTDELIKLNGYGEQRGLSRESLSNPRTYNGVDFGVSEGIPKKIDRTLTAMQKVTFFLNQLPALTDFANVLNIKGNHIKLLKHLRKEKVFNPRRAETLGLNPKRQKILEGIINKVTDKSLNLGKWTKEEIGAYKTVMEQLQRADVGESVLGDLPRFILKNPFYGALMTLLSFPIQSFDNLLLRDLYARDAESIFRYKQMLIGTGISVMLKDKLNGRETTEQEFVEKTLYSMPHLAMVGLSTSLFNDRKVSISSLFPSLGVLENALNAPRATLNIMTGKASKKDERVILQLMSVPLAMSKILTADKKASTPLGQMEQLNATISGLK
jgi:hypothetical protein